MLWRGTQPIVFDRARGMHWKGWRTPASATGGVVALDEIHALQVVSERCSGHRKGYFSYELNIVLSDGQRINVVDHGDLRRIRVDGGHLASFLHVPFWNP